MDKVRGSLILDAASFVREHYGPEAHARVLAALPSSHASVFGAGLREGAWEPLASLTTYMEAANDLLDRDATDFHRRLGYFAGRRSAEGAVKVMVGGMKTATKMANVLWRSYFDTGSVEVEARPGAGVFRVRDFPASRVLCRRLLGALEGLLSQAAEDMHVEERTCVLDGAPFCEFGLTWRDPLSAVPRE